MNPIQMSLVGTRLGLERNYFVGRLTIKFQSGMIGGAMKLRSASILLFLVLPLAAAHAQGQAIVMKITLPTINDAPYVFAKNFAAAVARKICGTFRSFR